MRASGCLVVLEVPLTRGSPTSGQGSDAVSRGVRATVPRLRTRRRSAGRGPTRRRGLATRPSRTAATAYACRGFPERSRSTAGLPGATRATSAPWIPARREPSLRTTVPRSTFPDSGLDLDWRQVLAWRQARQLLDHRGFPCLSSDVVRTIARVQAHVSSQAELGRSVQP